MRVQYIENKNACYMNIETLPALFVRSISVGDVGSTSVGDVIVGSTSVGEVIGGSLCW